MPEDAGQDRMLVRRYQLGRLLGSGAHGSVYLSQDLGRGGEQVALKLVTQVIGDAQPGEAERILQWFRHPNWAEVLDAGRSGPRDWFQALRYVPGHNLTEVGAPQPVDHVWQLLEDGARVLGALHRQGLIHYDVTPGNFILESTVTGPRFTLTDGGLAHRGPVLGVARGSPRFMAPEVSAGAEHDHRVDLYSLGLVAYWLLTGTDPHTGGAGDVLGARRRTDAPRASTRRADVPRELDDLLASLLARNPNERPVDALALLSAIGKAQGRDVPALLTEEIGALVAGGPLIGREAELERFAQSLGPLAAHSGLAEEPAVRYPGAPLKDSVLIIRGPRGSGCTRMAIRLAGLAREADVLVLRLSGRSGADDSTALLPGLLQCLGVPRPRVRQGIESGPRHSTERDIERAITALERRARKESVLLLVDSFAHLPEADKEFVRALSRHLQARMNPGSPVALPLLLVVDAGEEQLEQFVPVTRQHSRTTEMALAPLSQAQLLRVATERLGALTLTTADGERIAQRCDGLPGQLASLLLEAHRHGDLTFRHGRFIMNPAHIDDYTLDSGLAPAFLMSLERQSPGALDFLRVLALLPEGLSVAGATAVYQHFTSEAQLPTLAPLLRKTGSEPNERIQLAAPELRGYRALSPTSGDAAARAASALDALSDPEACTDPLARARLAARLGNPEAALREMLGNWASLASLSTPSAIALVGELLQEVADVQGILPLLEVRADDLMDGSPASLVVVQELMRLSTPAQWPRVLRSKILHVLESRQQYHLAFGVLDSLASTPGLTGGEQWALSVQHARLCLDTHSTPRARVHLRRARRLRRRLCEEQLGMWTVRYLTAVAQIQFLEMRTLRAESILRRAAMLAREQETPAARALVLNNLGIVLAQAGRRASAKPHLRRALRVRVALGDIPGQIKSLVNLGRVHLLARELVLAASAFQHAAALAVRHAMPQQGSQSLLLLARVYDAQANPRLAADSAHQSLVAGRSIESQVPAMLAAWELGPLAASTGDYARLGAAIQVSAACARSRVAPSARGSHHLMMCKVHMHLGHAARAVLSARRACRHVDSLYTARAQASRHLLALTRLAAGAPHTPLLERRPAWGEEARPAYRAAVAFLRATRVTPSQIRRLPFSTLDRPRTTTGDDRRLMAEAAIAAAGRSGLASPPPSLEPVERGLLHSGETLIRSRALATIALSAHRAGAAPDHIFSRSVGSLQDWGQAPFRTLRCAPQEHVEAWRRLAGGPGAPARCAELTLTELHAAAHRLLASAGAEQAPDTRTGAALRQVIRAAARMNAGGGQPELLQDIVTHAREITGARRVCILLADPMSAGRLAVARHAPVTPNSGPPSDISSTVIQRVTSSRSPLLLHDVFDDFELMGRPSITSVSLRSILCVPLVRGESFYGLLYADSDSAMGSFDGTDLEVLALFAEHVSAMLEANRLLESLQQSMNELKAMQVRLVRGERLRTIGELSSAVAHEFNNLLTSILARVQLLQLQPLGGAVAKDLLLVEKACLDAAEVVRRLQTFSRQQREQHFTHVDMRAIASDAVEFLRPLWSTRRRHGRDRITVTLNAPSECMVHGDPTELREVVTNLLKNALDSLTAGGKVTVDVAPEGVGVVVTVRDTGMGIPEGIIEKVFDPFFTTKGERGTGLGLSICQQIVERHGGTITIQSATGGGTAVVVTLPLATGLVGGAVASQDQIPGREGARVLVVDDDSNVLRPLCRYLEECGHTVFGAESGQDALSIAASESPELIISDVSMPGMSGLELCERLRRQLPDSPVLLMSGRVNGVAEAEAVQRGARQLIAKPFTLKQLAEIIREYLAERTQRNVSAP